MTVAPPASPALADVLPAGLLAGDRRVLARTISRVEAGQAPPGLEAALDLSAGLVVDDDALFRAATVAALVWIRPPDSVTGTRCTRCTPLSNFSLAKTPAPDTPATISLKPPTSDALIEIGSTFQPCAAA